MPASVRGAGGNRRRPWTPPIITITDTDAERDLVDLFGEGDFRTELADGEEPSPPPLPPEGDQSSTATSNGKSSSSETGNSRLPKIPTTVKEEKEEMLLHSAAAPPSDRRWATRRKTGVQRVGAARTRTATAPAQAAAPAAAPARPGAGRRVRVRPHSQMASPREREAAAAARAKDDTAVGYESDSAWDSVPSRYSDASGQWRARRATFFRNGDPWFQGLQMRFVPGRDFASLEALCAKISDRIDLPNGARYVFTMDGTRVRLIQELQDGSCYVCSSSRTFQVTERPLGPIVSVFHRLYRSATDHGSTCIHCILKQQRRAQPTLRKVPYGMKSLGRRTQPDPESTPRREKPRRHRVKPLSPVVRRGFGRTAGGGGSSSGGSGGSGGAPAEVTEPVDSGGKGGRRSGDGRVIKIVNNDDHSVQVKSFSQLRNDFAETDTFYLSGGGQTTVRGTKVTTDTAFRTLEDRKLDKIMRRYNSEPTLPAWGHAPQQERASEAEKPRIKVSLLGLTRTFYLPSRHPRVNPLPPDRRLKLDWPVTSHGYRGVDTSHNLWLLPSGELLYFVATIAVLHNRRSDTQRHYTDHTADIQSMDLHPSRHVVASGQRAGPGSLYGAVRVWGVDRLDTLHLLAGGEFQMGVSALCFSIRNQGAHLLAVDDGEEHLMSVWTWQSQQLLGRVATHHDKIHGAKFHPMDNNLIVTYGKDHLSFWTRRRDGIFDAVDLFAGSARKTVLCVAFEVGGDLITGDNEGFITTWTIDNDGDYRKKHDFEAHSCPVSSLLLLSEITLLSGGEKDRRICAWDCGMDYDKRAETRLPEAAGGIRTLCPQKIGTNDGNIYAGTVKNMILEGSLMRRFHTVVFGHSRQLWGLAVCHEEESFVTAGHDRIVAKWSAKHKLLWKSPISSEGVACSIHPLDTVVAVGSQDGYLYIFKLSDGAQVGSFRVCGQPLNCISYSPGGDMLAIGAQTGSIYPYKVGRDGTVYVKFGPMQGSQPLTQLDWSVDGEYLRTVTSQHELVICE
ncbi:Echinoderm microtubule-associated protein [Amphibalanus amphitrite]|uniref:Echinoderm microtubule-associated protein n=2 Tax=Amphibalanus amphitrite TaxID=1232801 RepID=A0A6A4WTG8_AMPAM|nr:Echinoderm microtubule-associated protein [Amphibalanus amphitrite]